MFPTREESLTLRDLAAPLFRRKRALITTFLCVFAAMASAGLLRFHRYEAHMAILVGSTSLEPVVTTGPSNQFETMTPILAREQVKTAAELLKSRDLLEEVVLATGIQKTDDAWLKMLRSPQTQVDRVAAAARAMAREIDVETPEQTNLIDVSYRSADPARAYGVLNSLGSLYVKKHDAGHQPHAPGYNAALEDARAGLLAWEQPHEVTDVRSPGSDVAANARVTQAGDPPLDEAEVAREAKAAEQEFLQYLARREQERASASPQKTRMETVAIAIPPAIPVLPVHSVGFILLIAFASSLTAGILTPYLLDYLDPCFHTPDQVAETLGILVVVAVPKRTA